MTEFINSFEIAIALYSINTFNLKSYMLNVAACSKYSRVTKSYRPVAEDADWQFCLSCGLSGMALARISQKLAT